MIEGFRGRCVFSYTRIRILHLDYKTTRHSRYQSDRLTACDPYHVLCLLFFLSIQFNSIKCVYFHVVMVEPEEKAASDNLTREDPEPTYGSRTKFTRVSDFTRVGFYI